MISYRKLRCHCEFKLTNQANPSVTNSICDLSRHRWITTHQGAHHIGDFHFRQPAIPGVQHGWAEVEEVDTVQRIHDTRIPGRQFNTFWFAIWITRFNITFWLSKYLNEKGRQEMDHSKYFPEMVSSTWVTNVCWIGFQKIKRKGKLSLWVIEGGEHVMDEEGWVVGREDMMKEKQVRTQFGRSV